LASFTEGPVKHNHSPDGARRPTTKYVGPRHYLALATPYGLDVTDSPYPPLT